MKNICVAISLITMSLSWSNFNLPNHHQSDIINSHSQKILQYGISKDCFDEKFSTSHIYSKTEQIVVAIPDKVGSHTGKMLGFELFGDSLYQTFPTTPVSFGRKGIAPINNKREGDGRTPSGIYSIGSAFGYQDDIFHNIPFIELTSKHYWMSDSDSSNYNTLLTYKPQTKDYEVMRRKDHLYKYGIIIRYNMDNVKKRWGSAIFFHVRRRYMAPTAGCIASSEKSMKQLIEWLNEDKNPSVIISYDTPLCGL